jgi:hypothetical protein
MKEFPAENVNANLAFVLYYLFKVIPFAFAAGATYLGYKLFVLGVTGQASLSVNTKSVSGQLLNAAPGLFFAIGGILTAVIAVWKGVQIEFGPSDNRTGFQRRRRGL